MEAPPPPPTPPPIGLKCKNVSQGPGFFFPDALGVDEKKSFVGIREDYLVYQTLERAVKSQQAALNPNAKPRSQPPAMYW